MVVFPTATAALLAAILPLCRGAETSLTSVTHPAIDSKKEIGPTAETEALRLGGAADATEYRFIRKAGYERVKEEDTDSSLLGGSDIYLQTGIRIAENEAAVGGNSININPIHNIGSGDYNGKLRASISAGPATLEEGFNHAADDLVKRSLGIAPGGGGGGGLVQGSKECRKICRRNCPNSVVSKREVKRCRRLRNNKKVCICNNWECDCVRIPKKCPPCCQRGCKLKACSMCKPKKCSRCKPKKCPSCCKRGCKLKACSRCNPKK